MHAKLTQAFDLTGRAAVVTGAASGIGRESALVLAEAGAALMLADINEAGLAETAAMIGDLGAAVRTQRTDVARRAEIDALAAAATGAFGRLDVWVNVAAVVQHTPALDVTEADMDLQIAVNLKGVYWGCVAAAQAMRGQGRGSIVNISSSGADQPPLNASVYAMTKAAVNTTTRALAGEFGPLGVRVNAIGPGFIYTPMTRAAKEKDEGKRAAMLRAIAEAAPMGMTGEPRDIALAVLYLASDASRFVTGQILRPNGGIVMPA